LARSLLEAAACAVPLIATDVPGCRDVIKQNETGFIVPPHDSKALANSIMEAVGQPKLLLEMGRKGRKFIIENYSSEIINKKTYTLYL